MAITGANYAHSAGGGSHAELVITVSAASTTLCCFCTKSTEPTVAPTVKDDSGDSWTVEAASKCLFNTSGASLWFATKVSKGTEKEIKVTGGTIQGVSYIELKSTAPLVIDTVKVKENIAAAKTATIETVSAANGSAMLVALGGIAATGAISAWGGTGPVLTQSVTTTGRVYHGWKILTETLTSKTFTATWTTEKVTGMVAVALKEETAVKGKATGELLLTGTSKGVAAQRVSGKASDKLLLTGTSKGVAVQVVKGVAAGTLLLTGTSKASLASVLKGNASGALLLTGTGTGVAAQRISAHAAGELLLTGAAKGTVAEGGIKGKATGTLLLTGSGVASLAEVKLASASGTLFFLGAASGSASEKTGKRAIFIFDE